MDVCVDGGSIGIMRTSFLVIPRIQGIELRCCWANRDVDLESTWIIDE
jgi:hypothetical protein